MRALRITFRTPGEITLPHNYARMVHGMLHNCWHERFPELHDSRISRYVFSSLEGHHRLEDERRANGKTEKAVRFFDLMSLEVRSPEEGLIIELARQLATRRNVNIGWHTLEVVYLQVNDRIIFPQRAILQTRTPVVVYHTVYENNKQGRQSYSPFDPEWLPLLLHNVNTKARSNNIPFNGNLQAIALGDMPSPTDATFPKDFKFKEQDKEPELRGWILIISAQP